jgi:hypothetical protein
MRLTIMTEDIGARLAVLRLSRWAVVGMLAFALSAAIEASAAAAPSERASVAAIAPGDQAATHALLKAEYELPKAFLVRSVALEAPEARAAEALGRECKGVRRGAPGESVIEAGRKRYDSG